MCYFIIFIYYRLIFIFYISPLFLFLIPDQLVNVELVSLTNNTHIVTNAYFNPFIVPIRCKTNHQAVSIYSY